MAMAPINLPATAFVGDNNAALVAGDAPAQFDSLYDRPCWAFDATDEECIVSIYFRMPSDYAGGTLTATLALAANNAANGAVFDVAVEAVTASSDTLSMNAADGFDTVNSATHTFGGTAYDLRNLAVTLTNKDSVAVGDWVRLGIRRDCDSGSDDAAVDAYLFSVEIAES